MPERMDPQVETEADVAGELATELATEPEPRWRRPALMIAGVSLLTLGAFVNAERLEPAPEAAQLEELEEEPPPPEEPLADAAGGPSQRHKGAEGKMGKPSSKSKAGLYAMQGPSGAPPPGSAARNAGVLGLMQGQSGQFLASPSGGAFAVDNDDEVWGGLTGAEIGEAHGVGGLGLIGTGRGGGGVGEGTIGLGNIGQARGFSPEVDARPVYFPAPPPTFIATADDPKSTFSIDVDTAAYANVRRALLAEGRLLHGVEVRTEELINYFDYDYAQPRGDAPFSLTTEVGPCPWNPDHRLVHVGVQGKEIAAEQTPRRNLVFLLDVSGSMSDDDKLPLVKHGLAALTEQLGPEDRVSIVVYAGAAGVVLPPTSGADKQAILGAMDRLEAGGSTNGGDGILAAYRLAEQNFIEGGVNRVLLATDGDFNVGVADHDALIELIEQERESGVFLSVLGVGRGFNDRTMEQLADKGNGNYSYLDGMFEARKVLVAEAGATLVTIAKDVKIQVEFDPEQVASHRLVGYDNRILAHHEFDDDQKDAGEIGAGHSVTAIYEIAPSAEAERGEPLMQLNLRYKQPDGEHSRKLSVAVSDGGQDLAASSNDYRFAAAVAAFAERLRGVEGSSYASILELAEGALGTDAHCYRHQFLELVWTAAQLSGERLEQPDSRCTARPASPPLAVADVFDDHEQRGEADDDERGDQDWQAFVLEVLRLLPPFLALPMFFAALRRPRSRRR